MVLIPSTSCRCKQHRLSSSDYTHVYTQGTRIYRPHVASVTRYHHSPTPYCFRLTHPEIGLASGFIPPQMKDIRCVLSERVRSYSDPCSVQRRMTGDNGPVTIVRLTAPGCLVITRHVTAAVFINQRLGRLEINHKWRCLFRWTTVKSYRRASLITRYCPVDIDAVALIAIVPKFGFFRSKPSAHSLFCLHALRQQLVFLQQQLIVTYEWFKNSYPPNPFFNVFFSFYF